MPARRIDPAAGRQAVLDWCADPAAPRQVVANAVRYTLEELALTAPGRSVEVRVPPYGAVQVIEGTTHRRGTPPNVVEMTAQTWLSLVVGDLAWTEAEDSGELRASGGRSDLSRYLPLLPRP